VPFGNVATVQWFTIAGPKCPWRIQNNCLINDFLLQRSPFLHQPAPNTYKVKRHPSIPFNSVMEFTGGAISSLHSRVSSKARVTAPPVYFSKRFDY
jgi:hypothetical protein